ncbi:MAG: acyl-CoA dehydrogenase family protein [Acidimicrobiales bacterium]
MCASWPAEYGGKGLSLMQSVILNEEFARVGAPLRADFFGDTLVGPTILQWGTEDQKRRFLPGIMRGETAWCQGFSEPDAGSDLASLTTTAVLDGEEWRVNGQKVWTTQAQYADYTFLLARTDPGAEKHAGISYLLVPMRQPGIEVRPITQVDGSAEFNEVWFSDARCPRDNVIGGVDNVWAVAMTTLAFERGTSATTGHRRFRKELDGVIEMARRRHLAADPLVRQELARAWSVVKIMEINGYRTLTGALNGTRDEAVAALGATNKMFWSEYHQWFTNWAVGMLGPDGQILTGAEDEDFVPRIGRRRGRPGYAPSPLQAQFFFARSETIWGGAAQIQRNIVGERLLGLPKEPRPHRS